MNRRIDRKEKREKNMKTGAKNFLFTIFCTFCFRGRKLCAVEVL